MRYMYHQLERLFKLSAHVKKEIKHSELKIESPDSKINRNMSDYSTTYIIYFKKKCTENKTSVKMADLKPKP